MVENTDDKLLTQTDSIIELVSSKNFSSLSKDMQKTVLNKVDSNSKRDGGFIMPGTSR